jgi:NAD(P) transhydrogenase subunit beta
MTIDATTLQMALAAVYILPIILFVLALKAMSNPATARSGIVWAGVGVLIAVIVTMIDPHILGVLVTGANWPSLLTTNLILMAIAIAIGGGIAYYAAQKVKMTAMPQMIAVYNGMGGGAAAGISAVTLLLYIIPNSGGNLDNLSSNIFQLDAILAVAGGLIGSISFAGSVIAFLKLNEWMNSKAIVFPGQNYLNICILIISAAFGGITLFDNGIFGIFWLPITLFFGLGLAYGFMMAIPIGGADMPVVISLFNAFTGIAVALDGFATGNFGMIVAGTLVGSAGSLLTMLMAKAMNRSIGNVLFSGFGAKEEKGVTMKGSLKPIEADDVAALMAYAGKVIVAPGYGMAVAQAQQKVKEMMEVLEQKGVTVKFAIHPVAGRMPGHMNVLLAEAGVPYDHLFDLDEINNEFESCDVAMVIGANDVVNPAAHREGSPIYGMPILNVEKAKNVIVLKRGQGKGFAGIENDLFYRDNTRMYYGDAQESISKLVASLKKL